MHAVIAQGVCRSHPSTQQVFPSVSATTSRALIASLDLRTKYLAYNRVDTLLSVPSTYIMHFRVYSKLSSPVLMASMPAECLYLPTITTIHLYQDSDPARYFVSDATGLSLLLFFGTYLNNSRRRQRDAIKHCK